MTFKKKLQPHEIGAAYDGDIFSLCLQPGSLLIFSDEMYSEYMHGIHSNSEMHVIGYEVPCINMDKANVSIDQKVRRTQ